MSTFNIFTDWRERIRPDHVNDIRRWFGYLPYDSSHDADIGMELNGMYWEEMMKAASRQIPKLRHGFTPKVSELALAIHDRGFQEMHLCRPISKPTATGTSEELPSHNDVVRAFSKAVAPNVDRFIESVMSLRMTHPDKLPIPNFERTTMPGELPDDILISANGSTYRCKPGERLRGRAFFNEVELDVEELTKLVLANQQDFPEAMAALRSGTNDMRQINLPPLTPPPERPYEDILAAVKKIEAWRAEDRKKHLTDAQVMQLCIHFNLYSLAAIQEFIQEYQR